MRMRGVSFSHSRDSASAALILSRAPRLVLPKVYTCLQASIATVTDDFIWNLEREILHTFIISLKLLAAVQLKIGDLIWFGWRWY